LETYIAATSTKVVSLDLKGDDPMKSLSVALLAYGLVMFAAIWVSYHPERNEFVDTGGYAAAEANGNGGYASSASAERHVEVG
jgi:hypothetical protein